MRRLTLLQQNDTHAHVEPHVELGWRRGEPYVWRAGGYAHIRAMADAVRREVGEAFLHVDSGDAIHGTGPAQWTAGAAIVAPLNAVGVEVMAPGNWEFGFGPEVLRTRRGELRFPMLACNVRRADTGEDEFARADVRDAGGVRVALVGLTSPVVTRTMPQPFGAGLRFAEAHTVLPEVIARVRDSERPDVVVLVSHYGFAQEVAIARETEGIDVILGGHTHDVLREPVTVGRTVITQSGAHGSWLTRLDLDVDRSGVCGVRHALIPVDASGSADPDVQRVVEESLAPYRERMDEIVGETRVLLHRGTALEAPMDDLVTAAYVAVTGADAALSHGWRYGVPVPPGPISAGDLWQMIPTNPELYTVRLTGRQITRMLERSLDRTFAGDPLRQGGGYVLRLAGMHAVVRLNNPVGARVQQLEIAGERVAPEREYVVVAAGEQSAPRDVPREMTGVRAIDAITDYLRRAGPFAGRAERAVVVI